MADKLEGQREQDKRLKPLRRQLEQVDWTIRYGCVKVQLRDGKPTLVTIEETLRLD